MVSSVYGLKQTRKKRKSDEETTIHYSPFSKGSEVFQLFFLEDNEQQDVEVIETKAIDFKEVVQRLKQGESIFMKVKNVQKSTLSTKHKDSQKPLFFFYI